MLRDINARRFDELSKKYPPAALYMIICKSDLAEGNNGQG